MLTDIYVASGDNFLGENLRLDSNVKGLKRTPGRYDEEQNAIEFLLVMKKKMDRVPEIGGQQRGYMTSRG